jgi:hypothetical protein
MKLLELRQLIREAIDETFHIDEIDMIEYDVENEQDIKEFIDFMREYQSTTKRS